MPETSKIAAVVVSDLHSNSTTAICKPLINLDDGGTYRANRAQRILWDTYTERFIPDVLNLTKGYKRVVIFNGDMAELDTKRRTSQIITQNKSTIIRMTLDVIEPLVEIADAVIVIRGTMAHTGKSAWIEEAIAADLDNAVHDEQGGIASWWHLRKVIGALRFDVTHHGRMGSARRTFRNAANQQVFDTRNDYMDMEALPPHFIIRSHNHRRSDSGRNYRQVGIFTPAWQGITEFGYRIGAENTASDIGGDIIFCEQTDGDLYDLWRPLTYKPKGNRVWQALKI